MKLYTEEQVENIIALCYLKQFTNIKINVKDIHKQFTPIKLPSDEEIEKGALEWCLGVDETGCCNTGDDYDNHELPAFISACKWYREQLKGK